MNQLHYLPEGVVRELLFEIANQGKPRIAKSDPDPRKRISLELSNASVGIINYNKKDYCRLVELLKGKHIVKFLEKEFEERFVKGGVNPGEAWKLGKGFCKPPDGNEFYYTYSERIWWQWALIIKVLHNNKNTRKAFMAVWNPKDIDFDGEKTSLPCTIGFHFFVNDGEVSMNHIMRSLNVWYNLCNDLYLDFLTLRYIANKTRMKMGTIGIYASSAHLFESDMKQIVQMVQCEPMFQIDKFVDIVGFLKQRFEELKRRNK